MKKPVTIIIWVIALVLLLAAAYFYYEKNKPEISNIPIQQNSNQPVQESSTQAIEESSKTSSEQSSTQQEKIMAPDFMLEDLDGNSVKLSDYRGKIVILNFWAVWCKYCKIEMPDLNELNSELEKEGDTVILTVDVQETEDTVSEYLTSNNISLKVLMDKDGAVAQQYGISGYPTTFILNMDGSLYTYISGATDKKTLLDILDAIKKGESEISK